ncbi:MAG: MFS transporter [Ruminococcus sp.]|nr:MFS transporter [Ruminococcus sp.]
MMASILLTMATFATIVTAPFVAHVLNKLGNRNTMFLGYASYAFFTLCMFLAKDNIALLVIFTFLSGVGNNLGSGTVFTICCDTIDEVEYLTGKRPQGIMTSVMMCTMKLGIAGAGIIFSMVLNAGGYVADAVQTPSAISAIHWNMFWLPMILAGVCFALVCFFKLNKNVEK